MKKRLTISNATFPLERYNSLSKSLTPNPSSIISEEEAFKQESNALKLANLEAELNMQLNHTMTEHRFLRYCYNDISFAPPPINYEERQRQRENIEKIRNSLEETKSQCAMYISGIIEKTEERKKQHQEFNALLNDVAVKIPKQKAFTPLKEKQLREIYLRQELMDTVKQFQQILNNYGSSSKLF